MKFDMERPVKLVMLGAGGTGGHIAPHIYRLLYSLARPARFIICDGDIVEQKNLVRQNFSEADLGRNKARVLAERYSRVFGLETEYVPNFIETQEILAELIRPGIWKRNPHDWKGLEEMVILLGAVDNNKSRQLCHKVFSQAQELVYIDSGNGEFTGQVVCGVRRNGRTVQKPVGSVYPALLRDKDDKFPTELSCAEASLSDPQSMAANITAATAVVNMVYNILTHGECTARQTDFSTRTVRMQTTLEKPRNSAA